MILVSLLTPCRALSATTVLHSGYLFFNGFYLFDYKNLILGVAAPSLAAGAVWAGGTLARYILEAAERARITKSFTSYVDPALVDYVLESESARLDGQKKELSVVFTDLE